MVANVADSWERIKELYTLEIIKIVINNNELASLFYLGSLIDTYWDWQRGYTKPNLFQSIPMSSNFLLFQ